MFFSQIPGHKAIKAKLISSVKEERIPHAQIVFGENGCGHLALSLAYVAYIMCLDRREDDSCGLCAACTKTHRFIHPDLHFSFPVIGIKSKLRKDVTSNDFLNDWRSILTENPYLNLNDWMRTLQSDNKQADINVRECIDIIKKLGLKSFESEYKILLMWMPENLGKEGNRLLKLIEEPTDNTFIILVAEDQQKILNTILSRCQSTYVKAFSPKEISQYLISEKNIESSNAENLARLANGNLNKALHLLEGDYLDYANVLLEWLRMAYKGDPVAIKKWIDEVSSWSKQQLKVFLDYGILFFREFIFSLATGQMSSKLSTAEQETAVKMQKIIDMDKAESLINLFSEGIDNISRNVNPRIMLMSDTLSIGELLKFKEKMVTLYKI